MKKKDLYWLAGLLEGDGNFGISNGSSPRVYLGMTDRDVVERAADLMKTSVHDANNKTGKAAFQCWLHGDRALVLMRELLPHMGNRRSGVIRDALDFCEKRPGTGGRQGTLNPVAVHVIRWFIDNATGKKSEIVRRLAVAHGVRVGAIYHVAARSTWAWVD